MKVRLRFGLNPTCHRSNGLLGNYGQLIWPPPSFLERLQSALAARLAWRLQRVLLQLRRALR
jgi:hypothetical protein